jgi:hypothetical protein
MNLPLWMVEGGIRIYNGGIMPYTVKDFLDHTEFISDHGPGFLVGLVTGIVIGALLHGVLT